MERSIAVPGALPVLHMMCGKIASGKSTLAQDLARAEGAVLISEDTWLHALYGDEMRTVADFVRCSRQLRQAIGPHVVDMLRAGVSVVLDFQANTLDSRAWMRGLFEEAGVAHRLHLLDVPDEVCLARLRARNAAGDHAFAVTDAQFHQVSKHFVAPAVEEGFDVVTHKAVD